MPVASTPTCGPKRSSEHDVVLLELPSCEPAIVSIGDGAPVELAAGMLRP
jgi:hypothetical protein